MATNLMQLNGENRIDQQGSESGMSFVAGLQTDRCLTGTHFEGMQVDIRSSDTYCIVLHAAGNYHCSGRTDSYFAYN
jgi:hypothetical protein